jgi:hypothetical protein
MLSIKRLHCRIDVAMKQHTFGLLNRPPDELLERMHVPEEEAIGNGISKWHSAGKAKHVVLPRFVKGGK